MPKSYSSYKVSLGNTVLNRAKLIFTIVSVIVLLILGASVFAESQTHDLRNRLTKPLQNLADSIGEAFKEEPAKNTDNNNFQTTSVVIFTSSSTATVNDQTVTPTVKKTTAVYKPTSKPIITPTQVQVPTKSYEERVAEMNAKADAEYQSALKKQAEWSAAQKAANDAWFQQQTEAASKNQADWWTQQQANMDAWKKANGF